MYAKKFKKGTKPYVKQFVPGPHYVAAHKAIASEIGIAGFNNNGEMVASGTISKKIEEDLRNDGYKIKDEDFIVSEEEFDYLSDLYWKEKDEWVTKHKDLFPNL